MSVVFFFPLHSEGCGDLFSSLMYHLQFCFADINIYGLDVGPDLSWQELLA